MQERPADGSVAGRELGRELQLACCSSSAGSQAHFCTAADRTCAASAAASCPARNPASQASSVSASSGEASSSGPEAEDSSDEKDEGVLVGPATLAKARVRPGPTSRLLLAPVAETEGAELPPSAVPDGSRPSLSMLQAMHGVAAVKVRRAAAAAWRRAADAADLTKATGGSANAADVAVAAPPQPSQAHLLEWEAWE